MAEQTSGLVPIKRALLSVSDKTGIVELARCLASFQVEIISTGGTATYLRNSGIEVVDISHITGFPEMMDGRVKTLHPRVHGGLLGVRENPAHVESMNANGIRPIDMLVVNLYPFEKTIERDDVTLADAIEQIDIGGPAMIRSAAKNFHSVTVVVSPGDYKEAIAELESNNGGLTLETRRRFALKAYRHTAAYDSAIANYLNIQFTNGSQDNQPQSDEMFPQTVDLNLIKANDLRYGENPHQSAALYRVEGGTGVALAELLGGKEMSYNNYVDADAAWQLVSEFDEPACAIIKHTNPAGVAVAESGIAAYNRALETDPVSAFGGIVAFNCEVDLHAAMAVTQIFTEVVIAPSFSAGAIEQFLSKKNLRVLRIADESEARLHYTSVSGGMLIQTADTGRLDASALKIVSKREPADDELESLKFAWKVCKHTKSNAIIYARQQQTIGVGAGQMSRVDSVKIGAMRARQGVNGSVLASDAFFPFRDGIDEAAAVGVKAVIQPGGSVRDAEVIQAADEHGIAMVFTGMRHFKH